MKLSALKRRLCFLKVSLRSLTVVFLQGAEDNREVAARVEKGKENSMFACGQSSREVRQAGWLLRRHPLMLKA